LIESEHVPLESLSEATASGANNRRDRLGRRVGGTFDEHEDALARFVLLCATRTDPPEPLVDAIPVEGPPEFRRDRVLA
jgi:hypothetical protein